MATPEFKAFRCGLTYADAAAMLWVDSDNPDDWRRKSRWVVLRLLASLKRDIYREVTGLDPDTGEQLSTFAQPAPEPAYPPDWDDVQADEAEWCDEPTRVTAPESAVELMRADPLSVLPFARAAALELT